MSGMHKRYMAELFTLQREVSRELDRAQLGQTPGDDFTSALGRVIVERQLVLNRDPKTCPHAYWNVERSGKTTCRSCGADTTGMEAMGS